VCEYECSNNDYLHFVDEDDQNKGVNGYIETKMITAIDGSPAISDIASQPSPMNQYVYSPASSSLPGMSPFPSTPNMNIISPISNPPMPELEDLLGDLGNHLDDIQVYLCTVCKHYVVLVFCR